MGGTFSRRREILSNMEPTKILLIGNPGAGKSTILNCLIGELVFKSGVSENGAGVTFQLDTHCHADWPHLLFMDTPGLCEPEDRKKAAAAITAALKKGGRFKIVFVVTQESGRLRREDRTTMTLVLDAAPITAFGVIVNKIPAHTLKKLNIQAFKDLMWVSVPDQHKNNDWVQFVPELPRLKDHDDVVIDLPANLLEFLEKMPSTVIDPLQVKQVNEHEFEEQMRRAEEKVKEHEKKMKAQEEELKALDKKAKEQEKQLKEQAEKTKEQAEKLEQQQKELKEQIEKTKEQAEKTKEQAEKLEQQEKELKDLADTAQRNKEAQDEKARKLKEELRETRQRMHECQSRDLSGAEHLGEAAKKAVVGTVQNVENAWNGFWGLFRG